MNTHTTDMSLGQKISNYHNTFPRVIYPTETHAETYPQRQYTISDAFESKNTSNTFNLGVYSLVPLDSHPESLIPIDPLCLQTLLSVLHKENGKLPSSSDAVTAPLDSAKTAKSTISILSYHSAVDDQLPILIEDTRDRSLKKIIRNIHTSTVISALNSSKLSTEDRLIFSMLNETLFDFYNLSLLALPEQILLRYYSLSKFNFSAALQSFPPLTMAMASNIRSHLLRRNNFHLRNPQVFSYYSSVVVPKSLKTSFLAESLRIETKAATLLSQLDTLMQSQCFWEKDSLQPGIIDFQIASYIHSINHMADHIPVFQQTISGIQSLTQHSQRIVSSFV